MTERVITGVSYAIANERLILQFIRERVINTGEIWEEDRVPTDREINAFIQNTIHGMVGEETSLEWAIAWFRKNSFRAGLSDVEITLGEETNEVAT